MADLKVLGITGSLRKASYNTAALRACAELLPPGMTLKITSIATFPMLNQDVLDAGLPDPVSAFAPGDRGRRAADREPGYNFSVSGVLKNAIDWGFEGAAAAGLLEKPVRFSPRPAGRFGGARFSTTCAGSWASWWRTILPKPEVFIGAAHTKFDDAGQADRRDHAQVPDPAARRLSRSGSSACRHSHHY